MRSSQKWWDLAELWLRSSQVVRASGCQCQSRKSPGFDPSILRHNEIWGAKSKESPFKKKFSMSFHIPGRIHLLSYGGSDVISSRSYTIGQICVRSPKFILAPCAQLCSMLIGWDPPPPPPPGIWAHIRGRYWSAKIDDISVWPPGLYCFSSVDL